MSRPYAEVIGDPIAHSKSPLIHNFWLAKLGIDAEYRACHVRPEELADYFARRRGDAEWRGCNVTIPHKVATLALIGNVEEAARSTGAANTVFRFGADLAATNTDIDGILAALTNDLLEPGDEVCIIGTGGAARAAFAACKRRNVALVLSSARNQDAGRALLEEFEFGGSYRPLDDAHNIQTAHVIINATSLGMSGKEPMPQAVLDHLKDAWGCAVVFDMVYVPLETDLLKTARKHGLRTVDGLAMLIGQAAGGIRKILRPTSPPPLRRRTPRPAHCMTAKRPFILGLTGSIGMGKSAVAAMFREFGVPVFDADAAVHELQGPDGALLPMIEEAFPGTTGPQGVDRPKLGAAVFGDPGALKRLEAIVHPAVGAMRAGFLEENADKPLIVFDIPLLFEKGGFDMVGKVAVVSAPAGMQRARVLARPGMTEEKFEQILKLQVPDAEKRARADFVIDTGTSLAQTRAAVGRLVDKLTGGK